MDLELLRREINVLVAAAAKELMGAQQNGTELKQAFCYGTMVAYEHVLYLMERHRTDPPPTQE
jgi:phage terminase Nu1 subunit (DNA packaging protein)